MASKMGSNKSLMSFQGSDDPLGMPNDVNIGMTMISEEDELNRVGVSEMSPIKVDPKALNDTDFMSPNGNVNIQKYESGHFPKQMW